MAVTATSGNRLPVARPTIEPADVASVAAAVEQAEVSGLGHPVRALEADFASYIGVPHVVAASNGTASLHLALASLGVGPGDEVIVPDLTYIATANAVAYTGASIVFADSSRADWQIDPDAVEALVTERTTAILPVHLYGHPCPMDRLHAIAERRGLLLVEDAAQAHGAKTGGRHVGTIGDAGSFSTYANKVITTGEGGLSTFQDDAAAERARQLRNHGLEPGSAYFHPIVGFNYRMSGLQAALGVAQLARIDEFIAARAEVASWYCAALRDLPLEVQPRRADAEPISWIFTVLLPPDSPRSVSDVRDVLDGAGIDTRPFFTPLTTSPPYRRVVDHPVAADLSSRGMGLPLFVGMTESDVGRVADALATALR